MRVSNYTILGSEETKLTCRADPMPLMKYPKTKTGKGGAGMASVKAII